MNNNDFVPQIPYGTRDFLPGEAARKRVMETALGNLFSRWGYEEIITPTIEYLETVGVGAGNDLLQSMFRFFDKNNRILALRPDMTAPIARVAATRLRDNPLPLKLFYLTNVFRLEQAQAGRQCEFYQAGVELIGWPGPVADAEVVALAVEAIQKAGLNKFQLSLGQIGFINGVMAESGLTAAAQQQIRQAMMARDLVGLGKLLNTSGLGRETSELLQRIPLLHGREEMLRQADKLTNNETARAALANLADIYRLLKNYGVDKFVAFDLGIIRDFDYYTGMVFEAYTPGLGFPVCGGGRYDNMLSAFGRDCPSTGFALGIERIMLALDRQGLAKAKISRDIYIGWQDGRLSEAIVAAGQHRRAGKVVELSLGPETPAAAAASCRRKGYDELIYLGDQA